MYSQREIVTKNTNKHFLSQIWSKFGKVKITENVEFFGREKINISRLSSVKQRARIVASSFLLSCDEISSSFFYINFFNSYLQFWAEAASLRVRLKICRAVFDRLISRVGARFRVVLLRFFSRRAARSQNQLMLALELIVCSRLE